MQQKRNASLSPVFAFRSIRIDSDQFLSGVNSEAPGLIRLASGLPFQKFLQKKILLIDLRHDYFSLVTVGPATELLATRPWESLPSGKRGASDGSGSVLAKVDGGDCAHLVPRVLLQGVARALRRHAEEGGHLGHLLVRALLARVREEPRPLLRRRREGRLVSLINLGHDGVLGVIRLRRRQEGLDAEEDRADGKGRRPLLPQHIE